MLIFALTQFAGSSVSNRALPRHGGLIDPKKNTIDFRYRTRPELFRLGRHISISIDGVAGAGAYITDYTDTDLDSVNSVFVPGDQFVITGDLIKIAGNNPGNGVFFVPVDDPSKAVKATRIAENSSGKIIGIAVDTTYLRNRIEIRTQYTGSGTNFLKKPRVITSDFIIEVA